MSHQLVLATDFENESAAFYLDGKLVSCFDNPHHPHPSYWYFGQITDALADLFCEPPLARLNYREESHHMVGVEIRDPFGPSDWDVEWPQRLEDTPLDDGHVIEYGEPDIEIVGTIG